LRVRAFVRKAIDEARRMVSELRPALADDGGLIEAIQFLVGEAEAAHRMQVTFKYPQDFPALSPLQVQGLARIVQEALSNVHRHAGTSRAAIRLKRSGRQIELYVQDRGLGFDPANVPAGHYGLEGMRERAKAFGGTLTIRSAKGEGTRITVLVPVEEQPAGTASSQRPRPVPRPSARNPRKRKR
jgi:signal transduction histidine kinase